jgi:hypothetical protein
MKIYFKMMKGYKHWTIFKENFINYKVYTRGKLYTSCVNLSLHTNLAKSPIYTYGPLSNL